MKTVFINNKTEAAAAYTDYCIVYRQKKGSLYGALKLLTFCRKIDQGSHVLIGDHFFTPSPNYKS